MRPEYMIKEETEGPKDHCFILLPTPPKATTSSVQFKMVSMRSGRPIGAPPRLSGVSPMLPLKQFLFSFCVPRNSSNSGPFSSSQGRSLSASSFLQQQPLKYKQNVWQMCGLFLGICVLWFSNERFDSMYFLFVMYCCVHVIFCLV